MSKDANHKQEKRKVMILDLDEYAKKTEFYQVSEEEWKRIAEKAVAMINKKPDTEEG